MDSTNRISRFLPAPLNPVRLDLHAEYCRDLHGEPVETRAVRRQGSFTHRTMVDAYFRELQAETNEPWRARVVDPLTIPDHRTPPTEADIRFHAWLNKRLAALDHERHGLWPRVKRFLQTIAASMLWPLGWREKLNTN